MTPRRQRAGERFLKLKAEKDAEFFALDRLAKETFGEAACSEALQRAVTAVTAKGQTVNESGAPERITTKAFPGATLQARLVEALIVEYRKMLRVN